MCGFTADARTEAATHARTRAVILMDEADIMSLLSGTVHVADLIDERIDEKVRRY